MYPRVVVLRNGTSRAVPARWKSHRVHDDQVLAIRLRIISALSKLKGMWKEDIIVVDDGAIPGSWYILIVRNRSRLFKSIRKSALTTIRDKVIHIYKLQGTISLGVHKRLPPSFLVRLC